MCCHATLDLENIRDKYLANHSMDGIFRVIYTFLFFAFFQLIETKGNLNSLWYMEKVK